MPRLAQNLTDSLVILQDGSRASAHEFSSRGRTEANCRAAAGLGPRVASTYSSQKSSRVVNIVLSWLFCGMSNTGMQGIDPQSNYDG